MLCLEVDLLGGHDVDDSHIVVMMIMKTIMIIFHRWESELIKSALIGNGHRYDDDDDDDDDSATITGLQGVFFTGTPLKVLSTKKLI